jgi:hypothetical protein
LGKALRESVAAIAEDIRGYLEMRKEKWCHAHAHSYELAVFKAMRTIMHLVAMVQFGYGCYFDWYYVNVPPTVHSMGFNFGGKLKFLTFWDAV